MTPILSTPNHEPEKQSSTIFHRDTPGKAVAKFFGPNHMADAEEFVRMIMFFEKQPRPAEPEKPQGSLVPLIKTVMPKPTTLDPDQDAGL